MTKKILMIKTSSMGDIIHALPVAYDIAQAMPGAIVDWVAEESFAELVQLSPYVNSVKVSAFRRWRKHLFDAQTFKEVQAFKADLRQENYDVVIDIQGLMRSALVGFWTQKPVVGYSFGAAKEPLASLTYAKTLYLPASIPAVYRYRLAVATTLGYTVEESDVHYGLRALASPSLDIDAPFAALAVNTSRDSKLWPEQYWVEIGHRFLEEGRLSVLFWGNAREKERSERIAAQIEGARVAPRTSLLNTGALLARADVVVGVDTGLTHLAAALARPSVGIFVSTPTDRLSLVGEGPVISLGESPSVQAVWESIQTVLKRGA